MRQRKKYAKFVQISSGNGLDALDEDGNIWIYLGNEVGWKPLNMKRLTIAESIEAMNKKYEGRES